MVTTKDCNRWRWTLLVVGFVLLALANLYLGAVGIPASAVTDILLGRAVDQESWRFIILEHRLPQMVTAVFSGSGLALAGLMLQTAFRNPLAGPSILGIDSGANLGVALVMLLLGGTVSAGFMTLGGYVLVVVAALAGAWAVITLLVSLSKVLHSPVMLLIAGVMLSYLTSSVISLLNYSATDVGIRSYMVWGMGSFAGVTIERLGFFVLAMTAGIVLSLALAKPLNALLLGEDYARNLGFDIKHVCTLLLLATGMLTATSTAFCGPIAFVGLAVPHLARLLFRSSNHRLLLPATMLLGAILTLSCNLLSTLPAEGIIPINVLTPLFGAPVVLWVILRKNN